MCYVITFVLEEGCLRRETFLPPECSVLNSNTYNGKFHTLNELKLNISYINSRSFRKCSTNLWRWLS